MYKCLVIDDEPLALDVLAAYINKVENLQLVDVTTNPVEGLLRVQAGEVNLVFLDIEMPGITGIEFMKLAGSNCKIIITTAYPQFALQGYEYNVVDYLLKPISLSRFTKAIEKLPALQTATASTQAEYMFVKSEYKLVRVDFSNIVYLEALRDYVAIITVDGNKILTLQSLAAFDADLPHTTFVRIHKSYIINISKINSIEKNKVVINNICLPVGETYRAAFQKKITGLREM
jgi:DNA-binding LytR/AlgR family response regulator